MLERFVLLRTIDAQPIEHLVTSRTHTSRGTWRSEDALTSLYSIDCQLVRLLQMRHGIATTVNTSDAFPDETPRVLFALVINFLQMKDMRFVARDPSKV